MPAALSVAAWFGVVGMGLVSVPSALDWQDGPCLEGTGVTVVVQSPESTQSRCALGPYDNALAATHGAGFTTEYHPGLPGMICVIDAYPMPCNGAPAEAYWSFWVGQPGQWRYATQGAGTQGVTVDDWVGWAFGAGEPPQWAPGDPQSGSEIGPLVNLIEDSAVPEVPPAVSTAQSSAATGWPALLGGLLLVLLAGSAGLVAWRRR